MAVDRRFSIKDLDPEAHALAQKAAQAAGISIEEWITRAIVRKMSASAQPAPKPQAPTNSPPPPAQPYYGQPPGAQIDPPSAPIAQQTRAASSEGVPSASAPSGLAADDVLAGAASQPLSERILLAALNAVTGSESGGSLAAALLSQQTGTDAPGSDATQRNLLRDGGADPARPAELRPTPPHDLAELKRVLERIGAQSVGPSPVSPSAPSQSSPRPPSAGTPSVSHTTTSEIPSPQVPQPRQPASGSAVQEPASAATVTRLSGVNITPRTGPASGSTPTASATSVNVVPMKPASVPPSSSRDANESAMAAPPAQVADGRPSPQEEPLELDEPITEAEAELLEDESVEPWREPAAAEERSSEAPRRTRGSRAGAIAALLLIAAGSAATVYYWPDIDAATGVDKFAERSVRNVERVLEAAKRKAIVVSRSIGGTNSGQPAGTTLPVPQPLPETQQNAAVAPQSAANPPIASVPPAPPPSPGNGAIEERNPSAPSEASPARQASGPAPDGGSPSSSTDAHSTSATPSIAATPSTSATPSTAAPAESAPPQSATLPPPAATPPVPPPTTAAPETEIVAPPPSMKVKDVEALAKKGDARAQHDLAALYARGDRVPQDYGKAFYWFREAALQGVASAQYNLGVLYDRGLGVEKNPLEALLWYLSAAEQGHVAAQYNVGTAYSDGKGVPKNYTEARKWLTKAAEQGLAKASYSLGVINELGLGANADPVEAYAWYKLASRGGEGDAEKRLGELATRLSPAQLGEANKRYDAAAASIPLAPPAPTDHIVAPPLQRPDASPQTPPTVGSGAAPARKPPSPPVAAVQPSAASAPPASAPSGAAGPPSAVVTDIQRALGELGYNPGPASGRIDLQTAAAIREFQKEAGLPVDGQATPQLLHYIKQLSGKS
jgi:TPR repeat protein